MKERKWTNNRERKQRRADVERKKDTGRGG